MSNVYHAAARCVVLAWDNCEDRDTPSVYGPFRHAATAQRFLDAYGHELHPGGREPVIVPVRVKP
jgi:hypothetical protein